jgi:cell division protein FtsA
VHEEIAQPETTENKIRKSFFDRYVDKIKDFLDNAE